MSNKRSISLAVISALAIASGAVAQDQERPLTHDPMSRDAKQQSAPKIMPEKLTAESFAQQAALISNAEIEMGQLALKQTQDAGIRKYAQKMVNDHTAQQGELEKVALKKNLNVTQRLDAEHLSAKDKLSALKDKEFDAAYSHEMAQGHDKAIALFESAAQSTTLSPELKQFAVASLPRLKEHRDMAHSLH